MIFEIYKENVSFLMPQWNWRLKSKGNIVSSAKGYNDIRSVLKTLRSIFKESPARMKEIEKAANKIGYKIDGRVLKKHEKNN
jgi:uncharacterized protein YegP (UPF0339 family)